MFLKLFLLDSSIRDNICFGNTYEEVKFENVINQSQLSSFLDSLEFRDNTVVGERGVMISVGKDKEYLLLELCIIILR